MIKGRKYAQAAALACAILVLGACQDSPPGDNGGPVDATLTVTFDSQGGGSVPAAKVQPGETAVEPEDLTSATDANLVFSGWYTEAACSTRWNFDDPVAKSMTLYAKWNAANSLTFAAISGGAAWEVAKGSGTLDADLYIPAYYRGIPVTRIASYGFQNCSGITALSLHDGLASLGYGSFWGCASLGTVEIPESVSSIEEYAFYNCASLAGTVAIPKNVASIAYDAFWYCSLMTAIDVDPDNASYSSIDGVLFDKAGATLIVYPCGKPDTSYPIPPTVTAIQFYAFNYNQQIHTVSIPSSLINIGYYSFINCYSFSYIFIPSTVTTIGSGAFACNWLLTIHCQASSKPAGWDGGWADSTSAGAVSWDCSS